VGGPSVSKPIPSIGKRPMHGSAAGGELIRALPGHSAQPPQSREISNESLGLGPAVLQPSRSSSAAPRDARQFRVTFSDTEFLGPPVSGRSRSAPMPPGSQRQQCSQPAAGPDSFGAAVVGAAKSDWSGTRRKPQALSICADEQHGGSKSMETPRSKWRGPSDEKDQFEGECFGPPVLRPNASVWKPPLSPQQSEASSFAFGAPLSGATQSIWSGGGAGADAAHPSALAVAGKQSPSSWKKHWHMPSPSLAQHEADCFGAPVSGPNASSWATKAQMRSPRGILSPKSARADKHLLSPMPLSPPRTSIEIWC